MVRSDGLSDAAGRRRGWPFGRDERPREPVRKAVTTVARRPADPASAGEFETLRPRLLQVARGLLGDEADAEDVVQEAYLRAFRSWHTFRPGTDVRRWLFTIARNVFLRSRERGQREVTLDEDGAEAVDAAQAVEGWVRSGLDPLLDRVDVGPAIRDALDQVPEAYRAAVILVDLEDQSYEAAAEVLDVPVGTVRSRLFRGRKQLQEILAVHAQDAGFSTPERSSTGSTE